MNGITFAVDADCGAHLIPHGFWVKRGQVGEERGVEKAAANLMIKLNDDPLAWTVADRALPGRPGWR